MALPAASAPPVARLAHLSRRVIEWAALGCVVLVIAVVLLWHESELRAVAEWGAVRATLGALRTAQLVDPLHHRLRVRHGSENEAPLPSNPFALLERRPSNYVGEVPRTRLGGVAPGTWFYEPACRCVGYLPEGEGWTSGGEAADALWFQVDSTGAIPVLVGLATYRWRGHLLP